MTRASRPHALASAAISLDGFLDDASPHRLVLSGPEDLDRVDAERAGVDAILVGAGTVRSDDPRLLVRSAQRRWHRVALGRSPSPLRVVLTRRGDLDEQARLFTVGETPPLVYAPPGVAAHLDGVATVVASTLAPREVLADLGRRGVVRLMVEGGAAVHAAFLAEGVVDELQLVHAPLFVGHGPRFVGDPQRTPHLVETRRLGDDVLTRHRFGDADDRWIAEACALAERCPPSSRAFSVGCVVVGADDRIISTGWSRRDGPLDHAEETALRDLHPTDPRLDGATVYCSLEPCGQRASRPVTCVQHILAAGIRRVVTAWREPPTYVGAPSGIGQLEAAGVEVVEMPAHTDLARRPNPR